MKSFSAPSQVDQNIKNIKMKHVIIIWGGIVGLLAAITLQYNSPQAEVIITESAPDNCYKGLGMLIMNNVVKSLQYLGV